MDSVVLLDDARCVVDKGRQTPRDGRLSLDSRHIGAPDDGVEDVVDDRGGRGQELLPGFGVLSDQLIGVFARRQVHDPKLRGRLPFPTGNAGGPGGLPPEVEDTPGALEAPQRRFVAGGVGVQGQNEPIGEPGQRGDLPLGQRRAHRRHHVPVAVLVSRQHVHVALDDDGQPTLADGFPGSMDPIEGGALHEDYALGRVDIFGRRAVQGPGAEADVVAPLVEDGDHQPASEHRVGRAVLAAAHEPNGVQIGVCVALVG